MFVKKQITQRQKREWTAAYLMIAPVVLGVLIFFMIPTIWSIYLSFTDGPDYVTYEFVGLQNYAEMLARTPASGANCSTPATMRSCRSPFL